MPRATRANAKATTREKKVIVTTEIPRYARDPPPHLSLLGWRALHDHGIVSLVISLKMFAIGQACSSRACIDIPSPGRCNIMIRIERRGNTRISRCILRGRAMRADQNLIPMNMVAITVVPLFAYRCISTGMIAEIVSNAHLQTASTISVMKAIKHRGSTSLRLLVRREVAKGQFLSYEHSEMLLSSRSFHCPKRLYLSE